MKIKKIIRACWIKQNYASNSNINTSELCDFREVTQTVKNLLAVQDIRVQSLGREDPLEKGMATHSSILTWRIPWTEEPGGLHGIAKSQTQLSN